MNDSQPTPSAPTYPCPFCQKPHDDIEALTRHLMFENCRIEVKPVPERVAAVAAATG